VCLILAAGRRLRRPTITPSAVISFANHELVADGANPSDASIEKCATPQPAPAAAERRAEASPANIPGIIRNVFVLTAAERLPNFLHAGRLGKLLVVVIKGVAA
jgi:hypothetical protein